MELKGSKTEKNLWAAFNAESAARTRYDIYAQALRAGLARGESLENAIRLANAVGALSTTAAGAQAAMPTMAAAEKLMQGK